VRPLFKLEETTKTINLVKDDGEVAKSVKWPAVDGLWLYTPDGYESILKADIAATDGLVVYVSGDVRSVVKVPTESKALPYERLTYAQIKSRVDTLTAQQLRGLVAWLIFINKDKITDNFEDKLGS